MNKLNIPANSTSDYELRGTFNGAGHAVFVSLGYKGTITLNNVNITTTTDSACIWLDGSIGDLPILTDVTLLVSGTNNLWSSKESGNSKCASIHIRAGAKLTIDGSGSLDVNIGTVGGYTGEWAPAIGAVFSVAEQPINSPNKSITHAGGDLVIRGGTITATGGFHSAGIGGGVGSLRNIVIVGGNITSIGGVHGAGIGDGCHTAAIGASLIVLPPAKIAAFGGVGMDSVGYGYYNYNGYPSPLKLLYLGDPSQKKLRVSANPSNRKNVNILFDVSSDNIITTALLLAGLRPDKWEAGTTGTIGYWETTGKIVGQVKIYSDTKTLSGAYYSSKKVTVDGTKDVHIVLEEPDLSIPYVTITQTPDKWVNGGEVTLRVSAENTIPNIVRIRKQGEVWVNTSTFVDYKVTENGTYWFEAEDEDGNSQSVSYTVDIFDRTTPNVGYDSG